MAVLYPAGNGHVAGVGCRDVGQLDLLQPTRILGDEVLRDGIDLDGAGSPPIVGLGHFSLGVEADWLPALSETQRTVGFNGTAVEDLNKLPVLGRVRLGIGLPLGFSVMVAWIPPIPINGSQSDLFSFSVSKTFNPIPQLTLGITASGEFGNSRADITCPASAVSAGADPQLNPFGCDQVSRDTARIDYAGLAAIAAYRIEPALNLEPYVSAQVTYMNLAFNVNAHYSGYTDTTSLMTQGATFAATAGLHLPIASHFDVSAEVFYSPLTVDRPQNTGETVEGLFNVRGLVAVRI